MGCQSEVYLGNNLTFSICTHDPDTGVLTDADAVPSYRIYEDETAAAILTGDMAKLDDGNTTGFYTELIACTTANGFEIGRSYTIYIAATVDGDTGGIAYSFTVKSPIVPAKNTGISNFEFPMLSTADHVTGATGLVVTAQRSIDGAAFGDCTNTPATEVSNGIYKIDLSAADLNGSVITLKFSAAGADTTWMTILSQPIA